MTLNSIKSDILSAKHRPKGIKVSDETWRKLKDANLIEMKDTAAWGIFDLGFQAPFYDGDIYVIVDPELAISNIEYELPPCIRS